MCVLCVFAVTKPQTHLLCFSNLKSSHSFSQVAAEEHARAESEAKAAAEKEKAVVAEKVA